MDLTLFVAVRDRQFNLDKVTKYHETLNCRKKVYDSSLNILKSEEIEKIKNRGFEYHYVGPISYWEKWFLIIENIDTEYILDHPDDDLILKDTIKECMYSTELEDNVSIVDGEYYEIVERQEEGKIIDSILEKGNYRRGTVFAYNNNIEDFFTRVFLNMCFYHPKNHSILRSKEYIAYYKMMKENEIMRALNFHDRLLTMWMMSCGRSIKIKYPYMFRETRYNDSIVYRKEICNEWDFKTPHEDVMEQKYIKIFIDNIKNYVDIKLEKDCDTMLMDFYIKCFKSHFEQENPKGYEKYYKDLDFSPNKFEFLLSGNEKWKEDIFNTTVEYFTRYILI